jgi:hypothetical protein
MKIVSIGHITVMGTPIFFLTDDESKTELEGFKKTCVVAKIKNNETKCFLLAFDITKDYLYSDSLINDNEQYVQIELESPISAPSDRYVVGLMCLNLSFIIVLSLSLSLSWV